MRLPAFVAALSAIALVACGTDRSLTGPFVGYDCVALGPHVSPASATLRAGDTLRVRAAPAACGSTTGTPVFRWVSSDTSVASVDSLAGLVRGRKAGRATISALLTAAPGVRGAMLLEVVP